MTSSNESDPDPDPDPSPRSRAEALITPAFLRLLGMQAAFGFSFSVFVLLPKYLAVELRSTASQIGMVMAAFGVASILTIPILPRIIDGLGRTGALVAANVLMALAAVGFGAGAGAGVPAILLRGLEGVSWAVGFSASMALVAELAPPSRLAQAIGLAGAASLAMNAAAPAICEPLAELVGYRPVFLLAALAAVAGALLASKLPKAAAAAPASPVRPQGSGEPAAGVAAAPDRQAGSALSPAVMTAFGVSGLAFGVMFTFLAPFAVSHGVTAIRPFFTAYTTAALAVRLLGSRLADRLGHLSVASGTLAFYGAVVAVTGFMGPVPLVTLGVAFGLAHGGLFPAMMALLLEGVGPARRPRLLAVANGAMNLGQVAVFPIGIAAEGLGYPTVFVAAGLTTVVAAVFLLHQGRRQDRARTGVAATAR